MPLNECQRRALDEILAAYEPGGFHLLSGSAGCGKTYLLQAVVYEFRAKDKTIALTAPTHSAVAVLKTKMDEAHISVECSTIHSFLSLRGRTVNGEKVFTRSKDAKQIRTQVVIIDECSMLNHSVMQMIRKHMPLSFVLFVGDPAQIRPVGETHSLSFDTRSRSILNTIVRQAADNPILVAATKIRETPKGQQNWEWCVPSRVGDKGIFVPGHRTSEWIQKAFVSKAFEEDQNSFRYICYRNETVSAVNKKIQKWRYGNDMKTPLMPGERVIFKNSVAFGEDVLFQNNEETIIESIRESKLLYTAPNSGGFDSWKAEFLTWEISATNAKGETHSFHMPEGPTAPAIVRAALEKEARAGAFMRWEDIDRFDSMMARLQPCYALTCHRSQGATYKTAFLDIEDIKYRCRQNVEEAMQLLYVAATRPTTSLILVNT